VGSQGSENNPPLIYHLREQARSEFEAKVADAFARYWESLPEERRVLVDRYQIKDFAIKVVGVGSVGTFYGIVLMTADVDDPLFLQVKEAGSSVLEPHAGKSIYENHGQRVGGRPETDAVGQRLVSWMDRGSWGSTLLCAATA